jgi:hypothetical protein
MSYVQLRSDDTISDTLVDIYQNSGNLKQEIIVKNEKIVAEWFQSICDDVIKTEPNIWKNAIDSIIKEIKNGNLERKHLMASFVSNCESCNKLCGPGISIENFKEVLMKGRITNNELFTGYCIRKKIDCPGHILDQCYIELSCYEYGTIYLHLIIDKYYERCYCTLF